MYDNYGLYEELPSDWFVYRLNDAATFDDITRIIPRILSVLKYTLEAGKKGEDNCPIVLKKITFTYSRNI